MLSGPSLSDVLPISSLFSSSLESEQDLQPLDVLDNARVVYGESLRQRLQQLEQISIARFTKSEYQNNSSRECAGVNERTRPLTRVEAALGVDEKEIARQRRRAIKAALRNMGNSSSSIRAGRHGSGQNLGGSSSSSRGSALLRFKDRQGAAAVALKASKRTLRHATAAAKMMNDVPSSSSLVAGQIAKAELPAATSTTTKRSSSFFRAAARPVSVGGPPSPSRSAFASHKKTGSQENPESTPVSNKDKQTSRTASQVREKAAPPSKAQRATAVSSSSFLPSATSGIISNKLQHPRTWTESEVAQWLDDIGCSQYAPAAVEVHTLTVS